MQSLILGTATHYDLAQVLPFVRSVRQVGYTGHVALLVDQRSAESVRGLTALGVEPVPIADDWQTLSRRRQRLRRRAAQLHWPSLWYAASLGWVTRDRVRRRLRAHRIARPFHHISTARYFHYYDYLVRRRTQFDGVMLTDVRDVIFQDDPFALPLPKPLLFFLEACGHSIGTDKHNGPWIRRPYGKRVFHSLAHHRIVCSGTTIGTSAAALSYLELMCAELVRLSGRIGGRAGFDQGVHNYLIRMQRFPHAAVLENGRGPVLTMGLELPERFLTGPDGALVNEDGSKVAVLHQYDRHERLAEHFLRQLGLP